MRLWIAALAALIVATPAAAQRWHVAETNNFIVKSEDGEEETRQFAIDLERFDMALRTLQDMPIGEEQPTKATKLTVYRFGDIGDIGRMAGVSGVAGFYIPRAGDSVAFTPQRERRRRSNSVVNRDRREEVQRLDAVSVLQHEYVHYFMMQHFPAAYPSWYVEGFAELMATTRFNENGSFHVGDPPQYRAYQIFQMRQFPLSDMLNAEHDLAGREAYQFYGTGWLLTHYLNFNKYAELTEYLTAIGQGEDSLTAAERIFGDLDEIDEILRDYRDGPFPGIDVLPADYAEPQVSVRAMSEIEERMIMEEMQLRRGTDKDEAQSLASSIRRDIAAAGESPQALYLLARAEYSAENYDAAEQAAQRLIALDADSVEGNLMMSWVSLERIEDDPSWAEPAREYAAAALDGDMADPRSRIAYYASWFEAKEEAPMNAIIALEDAFETAGSDPAYRVILGRQLVLEDRLDSARIVLMPIAFRGHNQGPEEDEEVDEDAPPSLNDVMRSINAGDRDTALAELDEILNWEPEDS